MIELSENRFAELAREAVDSLPDDFREHMRNVTIDIEPLPSSRLCREMDLPSPYHLLGLYHGVPLPERSVEMPFQYPDRISIYQLSIQAACDTEAEIVEQIRKTVLHEIGHFFGMDEDDLDELGYG